MKLLKLTVVVFFVFVFSVAFSGGRRDFVEIESETLDSWNEKLDLTDKKPGKYNIYVSAKDLGHNVSVAGPYNIVIDPDSDLPVTMITNPIEEMRVQGNLNIVGVCVDDDAVASVMIQIDDNEPVEAQGTDFWSYYLDTTGMEEGRHVIKVYGVDINGIQGKPDEVVWHLDRRLPESVLTSHKEGVLVSGKVKFSAEVFDGNNIENVMFSIDGNDSFSEVSLKYNKQRAVYTFSFPVDTRKLEDGPHVCWIKSKDMQGSTGIYTFLFFVDNTPPTIQILSPLPEETVNGIFNITGSVHDGIGLESLTWKFGSETGEFDIVKGNPWWTKDFDYRNFSGKSVDFQITAKDTVGNVVTVKQKISIDNEKDKPVLTVNNPKPSENIFTSLYCSGFVEDDDDPAEIRWTLDKGEENIVLTNGVFDFEVKELTPGPHSLIVTPYDINGVSGDSKQIDFVYAGNNPDCVFKTVSYTENGELLTLDYVPGIEIHPEKNPSLLVEISTGGRFVSGTYTYGNSSPVNVNLSGNSFVIPIPKDTPYGAVPVTVDLEDNFGRKLTQRGMVYVTNLSKTRNIGKFDLYNEEVNSYLSTNGLTSSVSKEVPGSDDGKKKPYTVEASASFGNLLSGKAFTNDMEIYLPASGGLKNDGIVIQIDSNTAVSNVYFSFDDALSQKASVKKITETQYEAVIPLAENMPGEITKLLVKIELKTGDFLGLGSVFSVLRPEPAAGINDEPGFILVTPAESNGELISSPNKPVHGFYLPGTDRVLSKAEFKGTRVSPSDYSLETKGNSIIITPLREGTFDLGTLVITDDSGKTYESRGIRIISDFKEPEIKIKSPEPSLWVRDSIVLSGTAGDSSPITSLEYSLDNKESWNKLSFSEKNGVYNFETTLDLSGFEDGLIQGFVRASDYTGKESVKGFVVHKDTQPPEPYILVPAAESEINGENTMVLKLEDNGIIKSAEFRAPLPDGKMSPWKSFDTLKYSQIQIGTEDYPISDKMEVRVRDFAENETLINQWPFKIDFNADKPVAEIHIPSENEVLRNDFVVSGVVYDDDGVSKVWYKIDDSPYLELESSTGFSIPIPLSSLTDNEHTISVYGEDIYGVKGDPVVRTFRVSLEEPKAAVNSPSFDETKQGIVDITGVASDKNGISRVQISLDNGNTFNDALGQENWIYSFDSNILQDGTHVVFVKVWDNYETEAMYSSLINIDNTAPEIYVNLPVDSTKTSGNLFLSGNAFDNINLQNLYVRVRSLSDSRTAIPPSLARIELEKNIIINKVVDISSLPDGYYNIEFVAEDSAGNITRASRNIVLDKTPVEEKIVQLYPLNGEHVNGFFNIYGKVFSKTQVNQVSVIIDGEAAGTADVTEAGYFRFTVSPEILGSGEHNIVLQAFDADGSVLKSDENYLFYSAAGPWVTIDNLIMGDFAAERPWVEGLAGYVMTESDVIALKDKKTPKYERREIIEKSVEYVEISFDNGKTFNRVESGKKWRYRLETQDMSPGLHFMIVRAVMRNGEQAVTKTIVQLDKTPPVIKLLSPMEGDLFNTDLEFSGLSSDDVSLKSVSMFLRSGDKASYEVPGFIQGLYFDTHFWGASLFDVGIGLTFFDDNVKLQVQYGQFTEEQRRIFIQDSPRYGGHIIGAKLLANVATIPFSYLFGPDWNWLSGAATLGANFSVFTETQRGVPQMLSAVIAQIEFPRITFENRKMFRTVSFYTEGQLWFIPSDVSGGSKKEKTMLPHISCGLRLNLF